MKKLLYVFVLTSTVTAQAQDLLTPENCDKVFKIQPQVISGDPQSAENLKKKEVNEQVAEIQNRCRQSRR